MPNGMQASDARFRRAVRTKKKAPQSRLARAKQRHSDLKKNQKRK